MAGGGGSTNTISQQSIPSALLPYFQTALSQGGALLNQGGPQYYPNQQVAPLSAQQQAGVGSITNTALGPNASTGAQNANEFETSGALLNPSLNPYLQGTFTQGAQAVQNQLGSEFAANGSNVLNSLPVQSDEMNNLATQLYGGAYNQGLQTMTQASALAPGIDQGTYLPGQELLQAGAIPQTQAQNQINAAMQQWNYNQQLPYNMLSWYSGLLGENASPFSQSNTSGTMNNNTALTDVGAGLAGYGLASESGLLGAIGSLFGEGATADTAADAGTALLSF